MNPVCTINIPIRTVSAANQREHWRVKAKRVKAERNATRSALFASLQDNRPERVVSVTCTRIANRLLDSDNLSGAFKAIRDEIADFLGVSDAPSGGVDWRVAQEKGPRQHFSVRVEIEIDETNKKEQQ